MPTPNFNLLLGAGFSRNWDGWLASEIDEYLLGDPALNDQIRSLILKYRLKGGFEAALGELQEQNMDAENLAKLTQAIETMFGRMNRGMIERPFEFSPHLDRHVGTFLLKFDAIFTLNQDLLLESKYLEPFQGGTPRWHTKYRPGLKPGNSNAPVQFTPDEDSFSVDQNAQPYFKLHGSMDWRTNNSSGILVVGKGKKALIEKSPLLNWYRSEFERRLNLANSRLFVIGYSFADQHINEIIETAVTNASLKMFVVDPLGIDVLDSNRATQTPGLIQAYGSLFGAVWPKLIGASRRPLSRIFGDDTVEFEKVMHFFI